MSEVKDYLKAGEEERRAPGPSARVLLRYQVEQSAAELRQQEEAARQTFQKMLCQAYEGGGSLQFTQEELLGVPEKLSAGWARPFRRGTYKVPIGRDALQRILPYCSVASTRRRVFEAYYRRPGKDLHAAALELLRARQALARVVGFDSWADFELSTLSEAASASKAAQQLLESSWEALKPALAPPLRQMRELAGGTLDQEDEAFFRALVHREADCLDLAEYLPAEQALVRLMELIGRASNVTFRALPQESSWRTGWHSGVRRFEVLDGPPVGMVNARDGVCLGYVYVELFKPKFTARPLAPASMFLAPGHVHIGLHFEAPSMGKTKLLTPDDAITIAHELGHAVHMLCTRSSCQQFQDLPLDVRELPSTFTEVLATQPSMVEEYARHHASGGPPPEALSRTALQGPHFFARRLQNLNVSLGLHSSDFDAANATADELRERSIEMWQRYSPVTAAADFAPLLGEAGGFLTLGGAQSAYLLCYLRADLLLHGSGGGRERELARRWLSPDFASSLRSQLLDRAWPDRTGAMMPALKGREGGKAKPHPLPPMPAANQFGLFARLRSQLPLKKMA